MKLSKTGIQSQYEYEHSSRICYLVFMPSVVQLNSNINFSDFRRVD